MFKVLIGRKVDELYKQIDEKDEEIMKLQEKIYEMNGDKITGNEKGQYCGNCIHGYSIFHTVFPHPVYGCELDIQCKNYQRGART